MNGQHWSDYTEAELAAIKRGATIHASRRSRGPHRPAPAPVVAVAAAEPAYPPEWLPEVAARATVKATQTPVDWLRENGPDPHEHRNGTVPAGSPAAEAYPAEWLSQPDIAAHGGLGGEGWINRRAA
jgi:hypothetical protein